MEKKQVWMMTGIIVTLVIVLGVSFAYWYSVFVQKDENALITDCFKVTFEEDTSSNILLEKAYPISDEEGLKLKPYKFSISNICTSTASYQINLESLETSTMPERVLQAKVNSESGVLLRSEVEIEPTVGERAYKISTGVIYPNETKSFEVRVWMDESTTMADTDAMNQTYHGKVTITSTYTKEKYQESILNGTDPVLKEGLIPVTIDNDGTVHKASESDKWYSYSEKKWANAVILNDETKVYANNEVIPEDNIESYFVWIPRYRYQIFNEGNYEGQNQELLVDNKLPNKAQEIKIEFESKEDSISNGSKVGEWLTHPAFTSFDVNGIWVGKFETGYKGSTNTESAQKNVNEPGSVQIKPNVNSWREIQVANAYLTSYDYKRDYDSHMMKNTEWGAVAYLQHSKYGSMTSVRINNNSNYVTGYAAVNEPTCGLTGTNEECNKYGTETSVTQAYNTITGYMASTTGNIYGVYDMSGGAHEYVMGVMVNQNNKPMSGRNNIYNSGFNGTFSCPACDGGMSELTELTTGISFPEDTRYYDTYAYVENGGTYNRRILGDATGEMGPFATATYGTEKRQISSWYGDEAWFVPNTPPWFVRGDPYNHGSGTGVFSFADGFGHAHGYISFRIVLSTKDGE